MSHYWTGNEPASIRQAQAEDWLEDLAEFDPAVVRAACREWRQTQTKRPLPADLRRLCGEQKTEDRLALPAPHRELTEEEARIIAANHLKAGYSVVVANGRGGHYRFTPEEYAAE